MMAEQGSATRRFGCPSCGGGLRYDIDSGKMRCDMCGGLTALADLPEEEKEETLEVTEYHCPQCGAAVYSTDTEVTSFCSFCGSDVVLTGKLGRTKRPARIVPFKVNREACEAAYRTRLKKYQLAPADLKKAETISHFRPVYVPFWSYAVEAEGPAHLEGKKSYTRGDTRYDETYDLSMDAEIRQSGILYDASETFEDETAALLKHTVSEAEIFHPAYLSGFYAQGADVPAETYEQEAAAAAIRLFIEKVKKETGMDSVELKGRVSENFGLPNARFREELVMMPVWLLAHRQGDRVVYTAVNGRTGDVVCDVLVSSSRIIGVTASIAAVIFLVLQKFLTLKPDWLMLLCAVLALIIQYQFSGAQKRLFNRRTRAFEPDFTGKEREFAGPAQSMLKKGKGSLAVGGKKTKTGDILWIVLLVAAGLVYGFLRSDLSVSELMTSRTQRIAVTIGMAAAVVVMIIHSVRRLRKEDSGPSWPRLISCAACLAGLIALLAGQVEDMIFYICSVAMLIASLIELLSINRAHNEYASRPVPFFGEGENEA